MEVNGGVHYSFRVLFRNGLYTPLLGSMAPSTRCGFLRDAEPGGAPPLFFIDFTGSDCILLVTSLNRRALLPNGGGFVTNVFGLLVFLESLGAKLGLNVV
eukprot:Filipodium_phascolosomae@DN4099_c0_g1_i1.p1